MRTHFRYSLLILPIVFIANVLVPSFLLAQTILWDQQPDDPFSSGAVVNQEVPDLTEFSTYQVNDATFSTDVLVASVSLYFTDNTGTWPAFVTDGVLNIFDGNGLQPTDDPTTGGDFGVANVNLDVFSIGNGILVLQATNLNIQLEAGTYWFGLTPLVESSFPQEFSINAEGPTVGQESMYRNPGGAFGLGTDWAPSGQLFDGFRDVSFTVAGEIVPEPNSAFVILLFGLGVACRRRQK